MRTVDRLSARVSCLLAALLLSVAGCNFRGCGGSANTAAAPAGFARAPAPAFHSTRPGTRNDVVAFPTVGQSVEFSTAEPPRHVTDPFGVTAVASPQSGGAPLAVKFVLSVNNPPPGLTATWSFGDDSPPRTSPSATHVYRDPGHYTAILTLTGTNVRETREFSISVTAANFDVEIEADPDIGHAPLTSHFTAVVPYGIEKDAPCDWDFGDGTRGSGKTITHTYQQPGTYTARVLVTRESTGQHGTTDVEIQVDPQTPDNADAGD